MQKIEEIKNLLDKDYEKAIDLFASHLKKHRDNKNIANTDNYKRQFWGILEQSKIITEFQKKILELIRDPIKINTIPEELLFSISELNSFTKQFQSFLVESTKELIEGVVAEGNKILFLASNPKNLSYLDLNKEYSEVSERLKENISTYKLTFAKVNSKNFNELIYQHRPLIIHFSGHGTKNGLETLPNERGIMRRDIKTPSIILPDSNGNGVAIKEKTLYDLFSKCKNDFDLKLIFFNSCHTDTQAIKISELGIYVIGMDKAVFDSTSIEFATSFYHHLSNGEDIETAFFLACNFLDFEGNNEFNTPVLFFNGKKYN
jgi:hypothetical protein